MAEKPKTQEPKPLPPVDRKSVESGLITVSAVAESRRPQTSVTESINLDFEIIGAARVRAGLTRIGAAFSGNILGIHYFVNYIDSTKSQLLVANGQTISYLSSANAYTTILSGQTAGLKTRFATYLNFVFAGNGTDSTKIWDGNTAGSFVTTGNASGAPVANLIETYRSRVWMAGNPTYPDRVFYSSVPSSVTVPVITWNTSATTGQWIDINPLDGDTITGLRRVRNTLLVFKTNHLYRIYDIGQVDPDPYYAVGTSSNESILETKVGAFFHHASGFYQYNIYGIVQEISRPIIDIVKAIPSSSYANITGWVDPDGDSINWAIGTVTYDGATYTNMVVRYKISTQIWTHRTYPTQFLASIVRQPLYTDGTSQFQIVGDGSGNTYEVNTGTTDDGAEIPYSIVHSWDTIDGLLFTRKILQKILFNHYGGAKARVEYQTDENDPSNLQDWSKSFGSFGTANTGFPTANIKGRKIRLRVSGTSSGKPFIYTGYELVDVFNEYLQPPQNQ